MSTSIQRTFRELFNDAAFTNVEIPIIQRDYAQGRSSTQEVRTQFIDDLYTTLSLPPDAPDLPLDLDFVYGSLEETPRAFCPLDGQQRLTTLFLLHWYLACKDNKIVDFQAFMRNGCKSRFTYKVRPSSQEFFDELVAASFDFSALLSPDFGRGNELSKTISDSPWFFLSWRQDPTIQSALVMLDSIHARFKMSTGYYDKIINTEKPYITFQFLNLHDFGLSDDLYIKMNARGKPLTAFEAFKARLEQLIGKLLPDITHPLDGRTVRLQEYFSHRIDSAWSDLFWIYRDPETRLFDQQFMNFIRGVALILYPHDREDTNNDEANLVLDSLTNFRDSYTFFTYQKRNALTPAFLKGLITLLDLMHDGAGGVSTYLKDSGYYDEKAVFKRILAGKPRDVTYSEWIQFYAYCAYIIKYSSDLRTPEFSSWMRVVSNLAQNTIYNRVDEFRDSLLAVRQLLHDVETVPILEYLSQGDKPIPSFNRQQVREERLKAQLMRRSNQWCDIIHAAEKHGYFKGQIEFLLKFAGVFDRWSNNKTCDWNSADDERYRNAFSSYFDKASAIFDENGLKGFPNSLWERGLLSIGNYLLPKGSNFSFLDNSVRDASWKRLLRGSDQPDDPDDMKRDLVKSLFDRLDTSRISESIQEVIDEYLTKPIALVGNEWRWKIVNCQSAISFCKKRQIRIVGPDCVYLLSKQQMNGNHAELYTYHLKECVLDQAISGDKYSPFDFVDYFITSSDNVPPNTYLRWTNKHLYLYITYADSYFSFSISRYEVGIPERLKSLIRAHPLFEAESDGRLSMKVPKEQVELTLDQVASILREYAGEEIK